MRYKRNADAIPEPGWTWRKPALIGLGAGVLMGASGGLYFLSQVGMAEDEPIRDVQATLWEPPKESYQPPPAASTPSAAPATDQQPAATPAPADPPELNAAIAAARAGGFGEYKPSEDQLADAGGSCSCRLPAGTIIQLEQQTATTSTNGSTVASRVAFDVRGDGGCQGISAGAMFVGTSQEGADFGAERSNIAYDTIEQDGLPPINLAEAARAADPMGAGGVPGDVDHHTGLIATRVAIATVTGLGNSFVGGLGSLFGIPMQESTRAVDRWANQAIDLDPTLTTDPSKRRVPFAIVLRRGICTG